MQSPNTGSSGGAGRMEMFNNTLTAKAEHRAWAYAGEGKSCVLPCAT